MKRLFLILLFALSASACRPAPPLRPEALPAPPIEFTLPQVEKAVLSNGIRVYIRADHELPLVSLTAMLDGGSILDPPEKSGRAALLARALRNGGAGDRSADAVDAELERLAADFSVSADAYSLQLSLSLLSRDLDTGLDLLEATLRRPLLAEERVELGRRQMIESIRRQNDHPQARAGRAFARAVYGEHPLGREASESSLRAINRADLTGFLEQVAHPDNLWIAVSGDVDSKTLLAALERRFGDWPAGGYVAASLPPLPPPSAPALYLAEKAVPQTVVMLGGLGFDKNDPGQQAARVMNYILGGGGFNSRLMQKIRSEEGLAYSVFTHFQVGRRLPGIFVAQAETKNASALEVVKLMQQGMTTLQNEPVSAAELKSAKESLINSFVFSFTDPHEIVTQAMRLDFYGYPAGYLDQWRAGIDAVTVADVQQAARERLDLSRFSIVLVGDAAGFSAPPASLNLPVRTVPANE